MKTLCVNHTPDHDQIRSWNNYCKAAHELARESYLMWHDKSNTRQGLLYENMKKNLTYFKCVFRKCKTSNTRKVADSLANKPL